MEVTTNGLVIREKEFKGDRILLLLTEDKGIITAYAKGAKSPKSRFASSTELFCYTRFVLSDKNNKYWVENADPLEVFFGLRSSIEKISLGSYICEVSGYLSPPAQENSHEFLRLLLNCLKLLEEDRRSLAFIKALFELRILTMAGFMPDLVGCRRCRQYESENMYFSVEEGNIICKNCINNEPDKDLIFLSPAVLSAMRHIIYSSFEKLFSFSLSENALKSLGRISELYLLEHMDFVPKTLTFLHSIL